MNSSSVSKIKKPSLHIPRNFTYGSDDLFYLARRVRVCIPSFRFSTGGIK